MDVEHVWIVDCKQVELKGTSVNGFGRYGRKVVGWL